MAKLRAELAVFHELLNEDDDPRQHATLAAEQSRAKAQILVSQRSAHCSEEIPFLTLSLMQLRCSELEDQVQQLLSDIDERDIEVGVLRAGTALSVHLHCTLLLCSSGRLCLNERQH